VRGLLDIHNAGKVHKDLHPGNILFNGVNAPFISDLGVIRPAHNEGVMPYMAPEVLQENQYTKAADIYSFGIIMNEFISEEISYNDIFHDDHLVLDICKGRRPKISGSTPKILADLIEKCWDDKADNRPTAKELHQILNKLNDEKYVESSEIYSQIEKIKNIN
jgi:serine/threonine protein kinase